MKLLILSDLHANLPALEAGWAREKDCDAVLCAGDLVDWGFFPREVVQWCQAHAVLAVAGNHDRDICRAWERWKADGTLEAGTFCAQNLRQLTQTEIDYLCALPESRLERFDGVSCYLKHYYNEDEQNRGALLERWAGLNPLRPLKRAGPMGRRARGCGCLSPAIRTRAGFTMSAARIISSTPAAFPTGSARIPAPRIPTMPFCRTASCACAMRRMTAASSCRCWSRAACVSRSKPPPATTFWIPCRDRLRHDRISFWKIIGCLKGEFYETF